MYLKEIVDRHPMDGWTSYDRNKNWEGVSQHFHLMLLLFQSSGLCAQSPSIIPVPVYPLCLVPHLRVRLAPLNQFKPFINNYFLLTVLRRCFFCGSFLLIMLHVGVCCAVVSCSLVVTCWGRADLLAVVFCHFPKYILVHIRIKREVGAMKLV